MDYAHGEDEPKFSQLFTTGVFLSKCENCFVLFKFYITLLTILQLYFPSDPPGDSCANFTLLEQDKRHYQHRASGLFFFAQNLHSIYLGFFLLG